MSRGFFGSLLPARKTAQTLDWLPDFLMWPAAKSGVEVNYTTALQVTAMLACVRAIAEGIAQVPAKLMQKRKGGRGADEARDHPLFDLLYRKPNSTGQTAFEFWETLVLHLMVVSNAYVFKNFVGGRIYELIILEPGMVTTTRLADRSLSYKIAGVGGEFTGRDIWHLRSLSWNGWQGMPALRLLREALGLSIALEEAHARLHANGAAPGGVYSIPGPLGEKSHQQLVDWIKKNAAAENRGNPLVLDNGATWLSQQMSGVDAQHLETRRFQIEEVCRGARVMPIMVGLSEKTATYASSEQMFLAHVTHGLMPWSTRLENSASVGLLSDEEAQGGLYLHFFLQALMRADFKSRQEGLAIQRRNGVINADEWRDFEDMNPRSDPGGPQYIVEANMALQDGRDLPPPGAKPATKIEGT